MQQNISLEEMVQWLNIPFPTPDQAAIIHNPLDPMLIVAGAGAGKTTTIALRICYLILNRYVTAPSILGLTFTRKACGELEHKLQDFMHRLQMASPQIEQIILGGSPVIMTYHAYCIDLVRNYGILDGIDPHFRIIDYTQSWQWVYQFIMEHGTEIYADLAQKVSPQSKWFERSPELLAKDILELKSEMSEHDVSAKKIAQFSCSYVDIAHEWIRQSAKQTMKDQEQCDLYQYRAIVANLVPQVVTSMIENAMLDYDLVIDLANTLTKNYSLIARHEQAKFSAVFLDEYQDTGEGQRRFLKNLYATRVDTLNSGVSPLSARSTQSKPANCSLEQTGSFPIQAVGDPLQSIYGWRGASALNLPRFALDFGEEHQAAEVRYLNQSWRNSRSILDFANHIAGPLRSETFTVPELIASPLAEQGLFHLAHFISAEQEARWISTEIQQLHATRPTDSIAILVRRNADIPSISTTLTDAGIEHQVASLSGLLLLPPIQEILAWLSIIDGNHDDEQFLLLAVSPHWNIGTHDLWCLAQYRKNIVSSQINIQSADVTVEEKITSALNPSTISLINIVLYHDLSDCGLSPAAQERLTEFSRTTLYARQLLSMSLSAMMDYIVMQLDIYNHYYYSGDYAIDCTTPCDAFMNIFHHYFSTDSTSLSSFLHYCRSAIQHERGLEIPAALPVSLITIMTIHAAKGLEFDHVFLAGLSTRNFPSAQPVGSWIDQPTSVPALLRQDISDDEHEQDAYPIISWPPGEKKEFAEEILAYKILLRERALTEERRLWYVACTRAKDSLFISGYSTMQPSIFLTETYEYLMTNEHAECIVHWEVAEHPIEDIHDEAVSEPLSEKEGKDAAELAQLPEIEILAKESEVPYLHWPRDIRSSLPESQIRGGNAIMELMQINLDLGAIELSAEEVLLLERLEQRRSMESSLQQFPVGVERQSQSQKNAFISVSEAIYPSQPVDMTQSARPANRYKASYAALLGTQFHEWVQDQREEQFLLNLDDLPGAADAQIKDPSYVPTLQRWMETFHNSRWSHKHMIAVEQPFTLFLAEKLIRGRIDAIFFENDRYIIVDWKTGKKPGNNRLESMFMQLALYRLAWSSLKNIPTEQIRALLYFIETDTEIELELTADEKYLTQLRKNLC